MGTPPVHGGMGRGTPPPDFKEGVGGVPATEGGVATPPLSGCTDTSFSDGRWQGKRVVDREQWGVSPLPPHPMAGGVTPSEKIMEGGNTGDPPVQNQKNNKTLKGGVEPPRHFRTTGFPGLRLTGLDYLSKKCILSVSRVFF